MGRRRRARWYQDPLSWLAVLLLSFTLMVAIVEAVGQDRLARLTSSEWAAWVQSIGSLLAIGVAIWIPYRQARQQHEDERARAAALIRQAVDCCLRLRTAAERDAGVMFVPLRDEFHLIADSCAQINLGWLPPETIGAYVRVRAVMAQAAHLANTLSTGHADLAEARSRVAELYNWASEAERDIGRD